MPNSATTPVSRRRRLLVLMLCGLVYAALVLCSNVWQSTRPEAVVTRPFVMVPEQAGSAAASSGRQVRVTYLEWTPDPASGSHMTDGERPTVVLLHGSPGDAGNFEALGPLLAARGYRVIAPDLPGFGQSEKWVADYSILAHSGYVLALLDALEVRRVHVVGWSMGGGVVLHVADAAPDRVASATLMASIGTQESEGSGDYWFEHFKYGMGYAGLVVGVDLLPHFGVLPERWFRHSSMRNFFDTDMRPLRGILERSRVPLLVLHGRYDVLAGVRGAEEAAGLSPVSRLVVNGHNHFLPVMQADEMSERLAWLFERHDRAGVPALAGVADLSPAISKHGAAGFIAWLGGAVLRLPWWVTAALIGVLASRRPRAMLVLCALVIDTMTLDFGVAAVGSIAGWWWQERGVRRGWGTLRLMAWVPFCLLVGLIVASQLATGWIERWSWIGLVLVVFVGASVIAILPHVWTWRGWCRLRASWSRIWHQEWWPANLFYLPLWPWWAWLSVRHGGPLVFTCANPGIPGGGGLIGESKSQIMGGIGREFDEFVLAVRLIEPGGTPEERAERAIAIVRESSGVTPPDGTVPGNSSGGRRGVFALPVILKPDMAFRGFAMRLARTEEDVRSYFRSVTGPVILQEYHAGPEECGLFWVRTPPELAGPRGGPTRADGTLLAGRVFAVTRKRFPFVTGDGRRTLEKLILRDPRLRCQWRVFFARHAGRLHEVIPAGERIRLAQAGNHAQGTLFVDGADLVTPALEDLVDRICDSYRGPGGEGYDFGRMDVRYESDDLLREGRGLGIVEMNGSTSEATNLYDPSFSVWRSYAILFAQWRILYQLGAWRKKQGSRGVGLREIARHWMAYHRQRSGSSVAD